jgi:hypothetical protein
MPALTLLGVVLGVVLFVILAVSVAAWWVAAVVGLGVIGVLSLIDLAIQWNRVSSRNGSGAYS